MGEGWSDDYALSLLNTQPSDCPHGWYAAGAYALYGLGRHAHGQLRVRRETIPHTTPTTP